MTSPFSAAFIVAGSLVRATRNNNRRLFDAPTAICQMCGREYDKLYQYREYCSRACGRLAKQRQTLDNSTTQE